MTTTQAYRIAEQHPEVVAEAQEQFQAILARSATDWDFRRKLSHDPHAAIAEHTGKDVDSSFNVVFIENKADVTIVLPDCIDAEAELSDAELEGVAGGATPVAFAALMLVGAAAAVIRDAIED